MEATAKDLRFHATALLNAVQRGEEVIITYRGKPCAKLIPMSGAEDETTELFGIWKDNDRAAEVDRYLREIRKGRFDASNSRPSCKSSKTVGLRFSVS